MLEITIEQIRVCSCTQNQKHAKLYIIPDSKKSISPKNKIQAKLQKLYYWRTTSLFKWTHFIAVVFLTSSAHDNPLSTNIIWAQMSGKPFFLLKSQWGCCSSCKKMKPALARSYEAAYVSNFLLELWCTNKAYTGWACWILSSRLYFSLVSYDWACWKISARPCNSNPTALNQNFPVNRCQGTRESRQLDYHVSPKTVPWIFQRRKVVHHSVTRYIWACWEISALPLLTQPYGPGGSWI